MFQTPSKDREATFKFPEEMLRKGLKAAIDLEEVIDSSYKSDDDRRDKFRAIFFALNSRHVEFRLKIMTGQISCNRIVKM